MLVITPNPAIDHTVHLARLGPGEVMRARDGASVAGGKGGNVSRAAGRLGTATTVVALVPTEGREHVESLYAAEGFELVTVPVAGRVRTCTALIEDDGRVTLVNEPGAAIDDADWQRFMAAVREQIARSGAARGAAATAGAGTATNTAGVGGGADTAGVGGGADTAGVGRSANTAGVGDGSDVVVCSGSLPPGAPVDGYAQVVAAGHESGLEVLVDVSGPALLAAIRAGADLVCPNVSEAEGALAAAAAAGHEGADGASYLVPGVPAPELMDDAGDDVADRARAAAVGLRTLGARWAVVTAGSAGAALAGPDHATWLTSPRVTTRNPIGAGDSFLAGVATARLAGKTWPQAIARGLASGSASVEQLAAGVLDPARVNELEKQIASYPMAHPAQQPSLRGRAGSHHAHTELA